MKAAAIDVNLWNVTIAIDSGSEEPEFVTVSRRIPNSRTAIQVIDELARNNVDVLVYEDPDALLGYSHPPFHVIDLANMIARLAGKKGIAPMPRDPYASSKQCPYCFRLRVTSALSRIAPCATCGKITDRDSAAAWNLLRHFHAADPLNPIKISWVPVRKLRNFLLLALGQSFPKEYLDDPDVFLVCKDVQKGRYTVKIAAEHKEFLRVNEDSKHRMVLLRASGLYKVRYVSGKGSIGWRRHRNLLTVKAAPDIIENLRTAGILPLSLQVSSSSADPELMSIRISTDT